MSACRIEHKIDDIALYPSPEFSNQLSTRMLELLSGRCKVLTIPYVNRQKPAMTGQVLRRLGYFHDNQGDKL